MGEKRCCLGTGRTVHGEGRGAAQRGLSADVSWWPPRQPPAWRQQRMSLPPPSPEQLRRAPCICPPFCPIEPLNASTSMNSVTPGGPARGASSHGPGRRGRPVDAALLGTPARQLLPLAPAPESGVSTFWRASLPASPALCPDPRGWAQPGLRGEGGQAVAPVPGPVVCVPRARHGPYGTESDLMSRGEGSCPVHAGLLPCPCVLPWVSRADVWVGTLTGAVPSRV